MTSTDLPETNYARAGDISIAYQVIGDGPVDIIFNGGIISHVEYVHEFPGYTDTLRVFARNARWVSFDKRGQGLSDRMSGAPTLEERAEDLAAVMDAIGSQRAVLVGWSEGALMCAYFAAQYPERVSHLVLGGGMPKFGQSPDYPQGFSPAFLEQLVARWGDGHLFSTYSIPALAEFPEGLKLAAKYERLSCSPGNMRQLIELDAKLDIREILDQIRVPTLVLHSKNDKLVPVENGRYFADHIPGARYVEHETAAHGDIPSFWPDIEEFVFGERHVATEVTDRILATVLFTDIVDSTAHAVRLGDAAWRKTLDEHDRILRRLVEQHRGRLIKTTGDGMLATFDGPGRAIRCALGMQAALSRLHISVRAGLHTGEVEERGEDIGGIAVHAAARVMSNAAAGQVLVSRVVADLVAGSGINFADQGETTLKGLPGAWRLLAASI
jgi:class 3 adenylate cyclase/alpha-beta hydrolase superfamily lysophospholipase